MPILGFEQLPGAQLQPQEIDPFELLNQQHTQQLEGIENLFAGEEQRIYTNTQYALDTLKQKHRIELEALEKSRRQLKPEAYRQRLIELDRKHKLQIVTAKEKIRPDVDALTNQRQNLVQKAEYNRALRETRLNQIKELAEKGVIQDPYAALQEQLQVLGYSYPISALKPPSEQEFARTLIRQALLEKSPRYATAKEKATKLQRATGRAMRKPGTMAEGTLGGVSMPTGKKLNAAAAKAILDEAGGDKELARIIAKGRGYKL